ncbi:MAG: class I SAM-dependent methyltransferase [Oscillatoriales cyanobacterium RM2_1_1]|nr:class I SAM-dependent methyltransferase [Oscillatoriales cyanobacterium SM2_3_0]NJO46142.1 class I SAM-dependent methyltransferase [Oscillatoriales cyanobacterium RM2_1_1]
MMMTLDTDTLLQFIAPNWKNKGHLNRGILSFPLSKLTLSMQANSCYFGHPKWAREYLEVVHRDAETQERWIATTGSWENKIVVDIGCAPGNVYAAIGDRAGTPKLLIGVDISRGGLEIAQSLGYIPVLADGQNLPFISEFADIVFLNAALHHCDDMEAMLREAARLVRPGGLIVTDHDVQRTMWKDNWMAHLIWNARLPLYRLLGRGGHATLDEQFWSTTTEAHHRPGEGIAPKFFHDILEPLGFSVDVYPHNRTAGAEVLSGDRGRAAWNIRLAQRLCGVNPDSPTGALVLMCVAQRL